MKIRIGCLVLAIAQILFAHIFSAQAEQEKGAAGNAAEKEKAGVLLGYTAQTSSAQKDWEEKFRDGVIPDNIRENMRRLSARPHNVGSAYDKDNAEWILAQFKAVGWDAKIESFNVLFPTPKQRVLELIAKSERPAGASLVQEPDIRAGSIHGIRCKADRGSA